MKKFMFIFLLIIPFCKATDSWNQAVEPIGALFGWDNIETLNLKGASITELPVNPSLPKLKNLYLNKNQLRDVSPTLFKQFLKNLPELRLIDLSNNPLTKENAKELIKVAAKIEAEKTGRHIKIITD